MNILADNPVFQREARWGRRLRRLRRNRPLAVMVAFVALAIGWLYWQGLNVYADPQTPYDNGGLWRTCSNVYLVYDRAARACAGLLGHFPGEGTADLGGAGDDKTHCRRKFSSASGWPA